MQTEKKTFTKSETDVICFENEDIITVSSVIIGGASMIEDEEENN